MVLYTLTTPWLMTVSGVWALCVASARGDRAVDEHLQLAGTDLDDPDVANLAALASVRE